MTIGFAGILCDTAVIFSSHAAADVFAIRNVEGGPQFSDLQAYAAVLGGSARLLSVALSQTYVRQFYPGGAIDHLLVATVRTPEVEGMICHGPDYRPIVLERGSCRGVTL